MLAKLLSAGKRFAGLGKKNFLKVFQIALVCAAAALSTTGVAAQSYQGSLRGAVRDSGGKALTAATLMLTNEETNLSRTTVTNESGEYFFERLDPGKYRIASTLSGFKKTDRMGILIETQQQVTLDLQLEIGDVVETVVITGDVPLMETSTASTGTVLSKQILDDLPNSGRNPFAISAITPTVIPVTFFPKPNGTGFLNNHSATSTLSDRADQQTFKLDHSMTERWKMSGFYARYGSREPEADYYRNLGNPNGYLLFRNVHALAFNNIISLSPATVLSLRYGYNTFGDNTTTISAGFDPAQLGFANSFVKDINFKKFPRVFIVGSAYGASNAAFGSAAPSDQVYYSHNLLGSVAKLVGKHSLKFGADYRRLATDFTEYGQASGIFYFNSNETGNAIANMLLGRLDFTRQNTAQIAKPIEAYLDYGAIYLQDDFRITSKLTINAGLRYEIETGLGERGNNLTVGFDPAVASPLKAPGLDLKGGLLYAGVDGSPNTQTATFHKFAPRVGFAYAVNDKTTIRGGYGIFYAPPIFAFSITGLGALGFSSITTVAPGATLSNPFPTGLNQPIGSSLGLLTNVGDVIHFVDQDRKAAYVQQFSVDVQRELPLGITTTLSYIGSKGSRLQIGGINDATFNINQLTPDKLSDPNLLTSVANPFFGVIKTGALSGATIQKRQLLRPFPQFGDIFVHGASAGKSLYHSFTAKAQKRMTKGLSFLGSYTYSRMKDNIIGQGNYYAGTSGFAPNIYDLTAEYGLASIDLPHRILLSGSYELPFGKGKAWLDAGGLVNRLVGGWQVNFIGTMQSGYPLSITQASNNTNAFSSGQRPNLAAGAFTSGLGLIIVSSQLKAVFGVNVQPAGFDIGVVDELWSVLRAAGGSDPHTLIIAGIVIGLMFLLPRAMPRLDKYIPASLIGVLLASIAAYMLGWPLRRVGALPESFPAPSLAFLDFSNFSALLHPAFTLAGLITINQLLTVVVTDRLKEDRGEVRFNRELIAQGVANMACPFFGAPPGVAMLARTVASARAGAVSRWSVIAHAVTSQHNSQPISRRSFGRMAALVTAGAALPFYNETALAQLSKLGPLPPDAVKINANENPLGPCPEAAEAIAKVVVKGGRYLYEETDVFAKTLADQEGLDPEYILPFPGSSDPLHRAVLAFTSKEKPFVMADPGYEAGGRAAQFIGAKVVKVPLTDKHAHDVKAMVKAAHDRKAGLIYICNPNNPTGTVTPRADIEWAVANKPEDTVVLLDEAYIHLSDEPLGSDLVAMDKDVIILRTFSKLYGMAGLRAGCAMGRPDLIGKLRNYGAGAMPLTGMVGATASLKVKNLVPDRRKIIKDVREDTFAFLQKNNIAFIPSVSNCFMLDAKMPARRLVSALQKEKVYIGRVWPAWPTHARVTVGTRDEMAKFKTALLKVMSDLQA